MIIKKPDNTSNYALACLNALSASKMGGCVSIGGAFGLSHYYEYRTTHDIDAWWDEKTSLQQQQEIISLLSTVLEKFGTVRIRIWGDVASIELIQESKTVFSFQIAKRSALLEEPVPSPWAGVPLDSFSDLIASKMTALVERGAPRDFRDIYTLCSNKLIDIAACWTLWEKRQTAAHGDTDKNRARLAIESHMERITLHRPLDSIQDSNGRIEAEKLRNWFKVEVLNAGMA